jgi:hypothetical protein
VRERLSSLLTPHLDGAAIISMNIAGFNASRPKTRRDRKKEHRGFAVGESRGSYALLFCASAIVVCLRPATGRETLICAVRP